MDFPSVAECIIDISIHYRLLPMQHGALSDDGRLLFCVCVYVCVLILERQEGWQTPAQMHCSIVEMIALHFESVTVEERRDTY